ncbi:MBL fold metallo-hydrolase [Nonomuraea sp. B12E4]|uniref:MBL fold metallo-hydrolase n=1 Tax=Nonomuraea sp. B12E4 TaxID=3153564 RepID=UPI00325EB779
MIAAPGHTDGSIALHLPRAGVLFTGAAVAQVTGQVMPGVFNMDRQDMLRSFRRLAEAGARVACVGHGEPVIGADLLLRKAARDLPG